MSKYKQQFVFLLLLATPSALLADTIGYSVASSTNDLYQIDLSNGMAMDLGTINTDAVLGGIAASSSTLYAVSTSDNGNLPSQLYNVTTPPGSLIGDTGPRLGSTTGAAYRSQDGYIYDLSGTLSSAVGSPQTALYRIDPKTGQSMLVGSTSTYANGLAFNDAGIGYATDFQQNDSLYRVSLNPFSLTLVGSFGQGIGGTGYHSGAAFDPITGTFYVLREDGAIFSVAIRGPDAGVATFDSFVTDSSTDVRVASSLEGLAVLESTSSAIPEPASLFLLFPALLLLAFYLRKGAVACS